MRWAFRPRCRANQTIETCVSPRRLHFSWRKGNPKRSHKVSLASWSDALKHQCLSQCFLAHLAVCCNFIGRPIFYQPYHQVCWWDWWIVSEWPVDFFQTRPFNFQGGAYTPWCLPCNCLGLNHIAISKGSTFLSAICLLIPQSTFTFQVPPLLVSLHEPLILFLIIIWVPAASYVKTSSLLLFLVIYFLLPFLVLCFLLPLRWLFLLKVDFTWFFLWFRWSENTLKEVFFWWRNKCFQRFHRLSHLSSPPEKHSTFPFHHRTHCRSSLTQKCFGCPPADCQQQAGRPTFQQIP